ncbi:MAG: hypothetical protein ABIY62_03180 [Ginsengibacter sp.]
MATDIEKSKEENKEKVKEQEKLDPGTTKGPDPQDSMEGPISSLMHKVEETFDSTLNDKPDEK